MYKLFISFIFALFLLPVSAQEYEVESFEITPSDLTATRDPRIDFNGKRGALIKIYAEDEIVDAEGDVIEEIIDKGMEKRAYMAHDSKKLLIYFKKHYPLSIRFEDYNFPSLTGGMTYVLKLHQKESSSRTADNPNNEEEILDRLNAAYDSRDYGKAMELALEIPNNPQAQNIIGDLYYYGKGVPQDYAEAMKWYRKAAELGDSTAMNNIGWLYRCGYGVPQDYAEAMKWFRKAAELGNASAMNNIGWLYQNGKGVTQDYAEAMKWYRKAAELGDATAMNNIGYLYQYGYGVPQDDAEAMKWYRKAADLGNASAMYSIGYLYQNGYGVPQDYAEAMKWYRRAADLGNSNAMNNIGYLYQNGYGIPQDYAEAMKWYRKAADLGDKLAKLYMELLRGEMK